MPERVSRLHPGGRPCVRLRLSGPDRRDPDAAAEGHRGRRRLAPLRLLALRRVRRRLPRQDRDPAPADPPAGPRGRLALTPGPRKAHHEGPLPHLLVTQPLRKSTKAGPSSEPPAGARRRGRPGRWARRRGPDDSLGARAAGRLDDVPRPARTLGGELPGVVAPHPGAGQRDRPDRLADARSGVRRWRRRQCRTRRRLRSAPTGPARRGPTSFGASARRSATRRRPKCRASTARETNVSVTRS